MPVVLESAKVVYDLIIFNQNERINYKKRRRFNGMGKVVSDVRFNLLCQIKG